MRRTNHDTTHLLRWFFTESAADVSGLRSSYWTLVEMAQSGAVRQVKAAQSRTPTPRALSAAARESDIAARLERLTVEERVVLSLAFGPSPWPVVGAAEQREDRVQLGEYPGVALVTERAQRAFVAAVKKRERKAGEDARETLLLVEGCCDDRTTTAWRRGEDPQGATKAMVDRGLVAWLRGPAVSDATLGEIRTEAEQLVRAALRSWAAVAPRADGDGRVRHNQRRRAAFGPVGQESDDGDRKSGEVLIDAFVPAWNAGEREAG